MKMPTTIASFFRFSGLYLGILLAGLSPAVAQVGFNNPTPDPSSLLDLKAGDRGLLIPRMTGNQRNSIASPADGLLVFDTNLKMFMFYSSGKWTSVNPWIATDNSSGASISTGDVTIPGTQKVGIGKTPATPLDVNGTITATDVSVTNSVNTPTLTATTVNATNGNGIIPIGGIIMWSGTSIPDGWALCNGQTFLNGQRIPDLSGRFIVGIGTGAGPGAGPTAYTNGAQGGEETHTLTTAEMPSHNHGGITNNGVAEGAHQHTIWTRLGNGNQPYADWIDSMLMNINNNAYNPSYEAHHDFTNTRPGQGAHTHTITSEGGNQAHENRPPYYALAYIMRIK